MKTANQVMNVYCDESTGQRYMVIGGIWCPAIEERSIQAQITKFKLDKGFLTETRNAELKWQKVSRHHLTSYKQFIDIFFEHPALEFRCIVVDTDRLDNRLWHGGDNELAFYKFYYYMLRGKLFCGNQYHIYTDHLTNHEGARLINLQYHLNKYFSECPIKPVLEIVPLDSKNSDFIQMADLLIGVVQADWNGRVTSLVKQDFMQHVKKQLKFSTLKVPSSYLKFQIFAWKSQMELKTTIA